jgi:hypothetical protein
LYYYWNGRRRVETKKNMDGEDNLLLLLSSSLVGNEKCDNEGGEQNILPPNRPLLAASCYNSIPITTPRNAHNAIGHPRITMPVTLFSLLTIAFQFKF